jgi:hypothetical protein
MVDVEKTSAKNDVASKTVEYVNVVASRRNSY